MTLNVNEILTLKYFDIYMQKILCKVSQFKAHQCSSLEHEWSQNAILLKKNGAWKQVHMCDWQHVTSIYKWYHNI